MVDVRGEGKGEREREKKVGARLSEFAARFDGFGLVHPVGRLGELRQKNGRPRGGGERQRTGPHGDVRAVWGGSARPVGRFWRVPSLASGRSTQRPTRLLCRVVRTLAPAAHPHPTCRSNEVGGFEAT